MSIVSDQVRRLDAQIDQASIAALSDHDVEPQSIISDGAITTVWTPRINELLRINRALSSNTPGGQLSPARVQSLLLQSGLADPSAFSRDTIQVKSQQEIDIEWLLVGKATVQTYGLIMQTLLDQVIPLSDDLWYWDEVLASYPNSLLYTAQTSPMRMWTWSKEIYHDSVVRFQRLHHDFQRLGTAQSETGESALKPGVLAGELAPDSGGWKPRLSNQWRQFYTVVRQSIADHSITDIQRRLLSRVEIGRSEARRRQAELRKLREMAAMGLGVLLDEGLNIDTSDESSSREWRGVLERSIALMDSILRNILCLDMSVAEVEEEIFRGVEEDVDFSVSVDEGNENLRPAVVARRLVNILRFNLHGHAVAFSGVARKNGRPSRLVRYWIPALALLVSSSTILRILVNRRDDMINWIQNLGATTRDFWFNWVVDPLRKIVGTIRHDNTSEIALMSRDSLKADRDSLERMVVEFALERPEIAVGGPSISDDQLALIRVKVREGDVTPVLKAYEKDMRKPFVGAVKGDLIRSLLIQVQKTKVDLEVAIGGIDALLKSQELVFGFIGLTPGVLVSFSIVQYLRTVFGSRRGLLRGQKTRRSVRVLRNIDRILSEASPTTQNGVLSYQDRGLLVCEIHVLRNLAHGLLPGEIEKEFLEDLDELANVKGIQLQARALERIRWAYAEWLCQMK